MTQLFGHEAHSDVQHHLLDARSSQWGVQQGHQDLEDSGELSCDLRWSLSQSGFQQTHHTLQLHIQLMTRKRKPQLSQDKSDAPASGIAFHFMLMAPFHTP